MLNRLWRRRERSSFILMAVVIAAGLALLGSLVLSIEAMVLARNASASFSCDLNAIISCGAVAKHESSHIAGFPNSFMGVAGFPVVATIGVILMTGVKPPRWFMMATQIGVVAGVVFAAWMLGMSLFVIQALCPWCMLVDLSMLVIAWGVTHYNISVGTFGGAARARRWLDRQYDIIALVGVIVAITAAIILKFGGDLFA